MNPLYTSRSFVESYADCNRYRYNQQFLNGTGLVSVAKNIPLVTGSAVHRGIEHLLNWARLNPSPTEIGNEIERYTDGAVDLAIKQYSDDCLATGFRGKGVDTDRQQLFTFEEQKALTEGLIRAWAIAELPQIVQRYKVISVEREIEPIEIAPGVLFQARVDAELQEIGSGDYHNYSLKTMKSWDDRAENSYKSDLQGVTEIWAVEEDSKRNDEAINNVINSLTRLKDGSVFPAKAYDTMIEFLSRKKLGKKVSAVRFCILLKGIRKKQDYYGLDPEEALYVTYSPLIRGYKNITPSGINYAWSWNYPNPENKSGKGQLGKGWTGFSVWESDISIKEWIGILASRELQPECGSALESQVIRPVEFFRSEDEILEAMREIIHQEQRVKNAIDLMESAKKDDSQWMIQEQLDSVFSHNRKQCNWRYGDFCEYKGLCWQPEISVDPVGSGLYQIRQEHHSRP